MCRFDLISDNTLYYFFSTIAQVLAATTALVSIVLQFRVNSLKKFLLGDGQALYKRWEDKESGYISNTKELKRLRDAIYREDYDGIKTAIEFLAKTDNGENDNGFKGLSSKFSTKLEEIIELIGIIKDVVKWSVATIVISLIILAVIDFIKYQFLIESLCILIVLILSIITLYKTYLGIKRGID